MSADNTIINLTQAAQPITHADNDMRAGTTWMAVCSNATVYLGGPGVTDPTGALQGVPIPAGQIFGFSDVADASYVCVAAADAGKKLFVAWVGV